MGYKTFLIGVAGCFIAAVKIHASPLTWFPGPPLDYPLSSAATVTDGNVGNVLIGGESFSTPEPFPQNLVATNQYWNILPALSGARIAAGAVAAGDLIIVYGGTDGTISQNSVVGYSPSGDTPPTLASMSVARSGFGYAPDAGGRAYAIGGLDANGQPLSSAETYNQDSDTWSPIASLPAALYDFPAVFDGTNQIYVFGGCTDVATGAATATVLCYSVQANRWTAMSSMPVATAGSVAAIGPDGKIYVVGGVAGGATTTLVQVYSPAANSWVVSTPLPEALGATAIGVDSQGRLIVMGGRDINTNDVSDVWRSQQLGTPDRPPALTQVPATNGTYGSQYSSSIAATGNPQPVYLLVSGTSNMVVGLYTGAVTWTPQGADQIGAIPMTLQASNYAGFTNWSFTITVPPPPPTVPTNLVLSAATDNSVTLTWDPEDPLVGPVIYNI